MKIALLGDIHGNIDALRAALGEARALGVEHLCVTGDLVGYYYHPQAVWEELAAWPRNIVRGNHEDLLLQAIRNPALMDDLDRRYGSAHRRAAAELSQQTLRQLAQLPVSEALEIAGVRILLCHGTPLSVDEYVYPDSSDDRWRQFEVKGGDFVFYGHTHYRLTKEIGGTVVVNPGSIGQPRDRITGAAWALIDLGTRKVELKSTPYDSAPLLHEVAQFDPEKSYLAKVLTRQ